MIAKTTNEIRFVLDGKVVCERSCSATTTVLEYLREHLGRTGTKEGCAEGDCGACTVVIGELSADRTSVDYKAVNSCIRFLPTIDGKELVTVESLQQGDDGLHPVQQAMVDHHASQCGFCTPGFVMSLLALYLHNATPTRTEVVETLAGNLCRCTGYRPIIDAGCAMSSYAEPRCWSRSAPNTEERVALLRSIQHDDASLALADFKAPHTLDELAATLQATPDALVLAGGTDVGLWVTKQLRTFAPMIYVGEVAELKAIREAVDGIWIGAAVSLSDAWPLLVKQQPTLAEYARRFASPPVCNSGTLGGNVANGSPIGDSMPVLLALGTEIELRAGSSTRQLPLEQFYLGYQRKDLRRGEFLTRIFIPHSPAALRVAAYKVSKRIDQDISAVCAAFAVILEGAQVKSARLAYGGLAAIPKRASHAEAALVGQRWTLATIESAMRALASDFEPLSDMRATREYRLLAASNLLKRFYLEQSGETTSRTFHADVASVAS